MPKFYVVEVNNDQSDTYAAETEEKAVEMANLDPTDIYDTRVVEAPDAGAARLMFRTGKPPKKGNLVMNDTQIAARVASRQVFAATPSNEEVKKQAYQMGRSVRESLSNLADRLSHELAGEVDATRIHQLLTDEHRASLVELTNG